LGDDGRNAGDVTIEEGQVDQDDKNVKVCVLVQ
jgi:hypothetical protein